MKTIFKMLFVGICLYSCKNTGNTNCDQELFVGDILLTDSIYLFLQKGEPRLENGLCVMKHTFELGPSYLVNNEAMPEISFNGVLYKENGIIYLIQKDGSIMEYFDLNMRVGQKQTVSRKQRSGIKKKHLLILEDKFYEDSLHDTIYKYRFSNLTPFNGDISIYLNSKVQFYGVYNGNIISDSTEEVFSSAGLVDFQNESKNIQRVKGTPYTE